MSNLAELLEKVKKLHWRNISGFQQFLFRYHVLLLRYFTGTEKSAFLAKLGSFLSITLQKE